MADDMGHWETPPYPLCLLALRCPSVMAVASAVTLNSAVEMSPFGCKKVVELWYFTLSMVLLRYNLQAGNNLTRSRSPSRPQYPNFKSLWQKGHQSMGHVRSDRYIIPRLSLQRPQKPHGFSLGRGGSVLQHNVVFVKWLRQNNHDVELSPRLDGWFL